MTRQYPRQTISLGLTGTAILQGRDDLSDWDIDELREGRRKNHRGRFVGRKPKVIPKAMHDELVRRTLSEAYQVLTNSVVDAVRLWADVLNDPNADMKHRLEAAKEIKEAVMGKAPIHVEMKVEQLSPYEKAMAGVTVTRTVVIREKDDSKKAINVRSKQR